MSRTAPPPRLLKLLQEALTHHRAGRLSLAADGYRAALKIEPKNADANRLLGALLMQRGDLPAARSHLRAALAAAPRDPNNHYFMGRILVDEGRLADAAVAFVDCLRLQPSYIDARIMLALVQMNTGALAASIATLQDVLRQAPNSADALINLAEAQLRLGQLAQARDAIVAARAVAPNLPAVHRKQASIALQLCDWAEASLFDTLAQGDGLDDVDALEFGQVAGNVLLPWKATATILRHRAEAICPAPARPLTARPASANATGVCGSAIFHRICAAMPSANSWPV